jgi:uncharacterized protein YrrD
MHINEMLGKPIVSADTGEKFGHVDEVLLDSGRHLVVGLLVTDGVLSKQRVLPFADVQTAGVDAVIVRTVATLRDASGWLADGLPATRWRTLLGKPVVTAEGTRLGTVHDLIAEAHSGRVVALEIARKRTAPALIHGVDQIELTQDVIVVPQTAAGTLLA